LISHGERQQALVNSLADSLGLSVNRRGLELHWLQLKLTLTHQKLALAGRPYKGSSLVMTCWNFIRSALKDPEVSLARKLQVSCWAAASTLLPRSLSEKVATYGFDLAPRSGFKKLFRRSWNAAKIPVASPAMEKEAGA
jgi:hypothetical protein